MNRKVLVTELSLEAIADAIRNKNGTSTTYRPGNMADAIRDIKTLSATVTGTTLYLTGDGASVNYTMAEVTDNG